MEMVVKMLTAATRDQPLKEQKNLNNMVRELEDNTANQKNGQHRNSIVPGRYRISSYIVVNAVG